MNSRAKAVLILGFLGFLSQNCADYVGNTKGGSSSDLQGAQGGDIPYSCGSDNLTSLIQPDGQVNFAISSQHQALLNQLQTLLQDLNGQLATTQQLQIYQSIVSQLLIAESIENLGGADSLPDLMDTTTSLQDPNNPLYEKAAADLEANPDPPLAMSAACQAYIEEVIGQSPADTISQIIANYKGLLNPNSLSLFNAIKGSGASDSNTTSQITSDGADSNTVKSSSGTSGDQIAKDAVTALFAVTAVAALVVGFYMGRKAYRASTVEIEAYKSITKALGTGSEPDIKAAQVKIAEYLGKEDVSKTVKARLTKLKGALEASKEADKEHPPSPSVDEEPSERLVEPKGKQLLTPAEASLRELTETAESYRTKSTRASAGIALGAFFAALGGIVLTNTVP